MLDTFIWRIVPACLIIVAAIGALTWYGHVSAGSAATGARDEAIVALKGTNGIKQADAARCYAEPDGYCAQLAYLIVPLQGRSLATMSAEVLNAMAAQGCVPKSETDGDSTAFRTAYYSQHAYDWESDSGGCFLAYVPRGSADQEMPRVDTGPGGLREVVTEVGIDSGPVVVATFYKSYWSPRRLAVW